MATRLKWSRSEAENYLAGNPHFKPAKPLDSYSTAELKRKASYYKRAEQQGFTPSVSGSRGHADVRHVPRREPGKGPRALPPRPEQYQTGSTQRKATPKDVENLLKHAQNPPKPRKGQPPRTPAKPRGTAGGGIISGNVTGRLAQDYGHITAGEIATLSFHISVNDFDLMRSQFSNTTDLANNLLAGSGFDAVFTEVYAFSIVVT